MMPLILPAILTWNLMSGSLFIGYPAKPVVRVCIEDEYCFTPTNTVGDVIDWDGPPPVVRAELADGSVQYAVPWPGYSG